jgi:hypothetical protein
MLQIEAQLAQMLSFTYANTDGRTKIDTFRGMVQLRSEGRRLANAVARMLGMRGVRCDMFAPGTPIADDDPWRDPFVSPTFSEWRKGP